MTAIGARAIVFLALGVTTFLWGAVAWADKVAVLPFSGASGGTGTTTSADLESARSDTRTAVQRLRHTLPSDSETLTAEMAVKDGVPDTTAEYRAAGRASGAAWTLVGRVDASGRGGASYRLEIEACQVASGRVESLTREVDARQAPAQIGEMLALLVRPEGIGNTEPPWERAVPPPPPALSTPPQGAAPPAAVAPTPVTTTPPPAPARETPPYAAGKPLAVGLGVGLLAAVHRADNARGAGTAGTVAGSLAYAIAGVPGLELRAELAGHAFGPHAIRFDAGGRMMFALAPSAGIFVGPEIAIGAFFPTGGDQSTRFLLRGAVPFAWRASEVVQLELVPEFAYAPGGSAALVLAGGELRGVVRF